MATNTLLITGGDGFSGQHAYQYFLDRGYNVFTTSRQTENEHTFKLDLTDQRRVQRMIEQLKPNYVLHLAGQNEVSKSWKDPLCTFEANVTATLTLMEAIRQFHLQTNIVIVGSILEDDLVENTSASHPYGLTKAFQALTAKKWVDFYQLNIIIAKPVNLIGPGFSDGVCAQFAKQIAKMEAHNHPEMLTVSNPAVMRDFLDVRDAIRAYEVLLLKGETGTSYDIGTGVYTSLMDVVKLYQQLSKISFPIDIQHQSVQVLSRVANQDKLSSLEWSQNYTIKQSLLDCLNFYRRIMKAGGDEAG